MKEIDNGKGNPVWFPVRAKGFFDAYSESSMTMGRLLRNIQNPAAEYYMLIEVKGKALSDVLSNLHIGLDGEIRILDRAGNIVYGADNGLLGQPSYIQPAEVKAEGMEQSFTAADEQGSSQLVVYQPLVTADWTLLGYAPVSDFTNSADRLLYITLLVVLAAAVIALVIGYILVRLIGRPLGKLARLMEEGEQGNLQVRTNFKGQDEIGRLGHSFNRMMEQISRLAGQSSSSAAAVLATSEQLVLASGATPHSCQGSGRRNRGDRRWGSQPGSRSGEQQPQGGADGRQDGRSGGDECSHGRFRRKGHGGKRPGSGADEEAGGSKRICPEDDESDSGELGYAA